MKDFKKNISAFIVVLCICVSANAYGQEQDHKDGYNAALGYYEGGSYETALTYLNSFMASMEEEPGAWIDPGEDYVELIYKVYRLAATCYSDSGDSGSADVIFDNLVFVFSEYYYEADIISRYNDTDILTKY